MKTLKNYGNFVYCQAEHSDSKCIIIKPFSCRQMSTSLQKKLIIEFDILHVRITHIKNVFDMSYKKQMSVPGTVLPIT